MCTIRSRCSSEREKLRRKSAKSAQKRDLSGHRDTGKTGTCSCPSAATKGPRGAATCARSSPNCCQMHDGSVTSGLIHPGSQGTGAHPEWRWGREGG